MTDIIKVLFIDDDYDDFIIVEKYLSKIQRVTFDVERASSYEEALEKMKSGDYDVYLLDYCLEAKTGLEFLEESMSLGCDKPIIFLTGQKNANIDIKALELGATDYLVKDQIDPQILERTIRYSIERKRLEKKINQEKKLKEMIIDITVAGICVVDANSDEIIDVNKSFLSMFGLKKQYFISKKFHDIIKISIYKSNLYSNDFEGTHVCKPDKCPCVSKPIDCRVFVGDDIYIDCMLSCRSMEVINGKNRLIRIVTMIDTTRHKFVEKKLIETTNELQSKIEEFGLETKSPKAILSLIDCEINKFKRIEEIAEWVG